MEDPSRAGGDQKSSLLEKLLSESWTAGLLNRGLLILEEDCGVPSSAFRVVIAGLCWVAKKSSVPLLLKLFD